MSQKPEHIEAEEEGVEVQPETRKPYTKPEIIHELELETRTGSPLGMPDEFDLLDLDQPKY
jgi:hypothetical protein